MMTRQADSLASESTLSLSQEGNPENRLRESSGGSRLVSSEGHYTARELNRFGPNRFILDCFVFQFEEADFDDLELSEVAFPGHYRLCVDWDEPAHRTEAHSPRVFQVIDNRGAPNESHAYLFEEI